VAQHQGEQRKEERVRTAWRLDLGNNASGTTRDVSASGIFFETEAAYALGAAIRFAIEIETAAGRMLLSCLGEIVRVEQLEARRGVAVRIHDSALRPCSAPSREAMPS
jgi:PilZ domain-containing protein